jgi:hypothetical protein
LSTILLSCYGNHAENKEKWLLRSGSCAHVHLRESKNYWGNRLFCIMITVAFVGFTAGVRLELRSSEVGGKHPATELQRQPQPRAVDPPDLWCTWLLVEWLRQEVTSLGAWPGRLYIALNSSFSPSLLPGHHFCRHLVLPHHGPKHWSQVIIDWHSDTMTLKSTCPLFKLIPLGVIMSK